MSNHSNKNTGLGVGAIIFLLFLGVLLYNAFSETTLAGDCGLSSVNKEFYRLIKENVHTPDIAGLHSILSYNPNISYKLVNMEEDFRGQDYTRCKADLKFSNYKPDTIAGYSLSGKPFTLDNAHCYIIYLVVHSGSDKIKVTTWGYGCNSTEGFINR